MTSEELVKCKLTEITANETVEMPKVNGLRLAHSVKTIINYHISICEIGLLSAVNMFQKMSMYDNRVTNR